MVIGNLAGWRAMIVTRITATVSQELFNERRMGRLVECRSQRRRGHEKDAFVLSTSQNAEIVVGFIKVTMLKNR